MQKNKLLGLLALGLLGTGAIMTNAAVNADTTTTVSSSSNSSSSSSSASSSSTSTSSSSSSSSASSSSNSSSSSSSSSSVSTSSSSSSSKNNKVTVIPPTTDAYSIKQQVSVERAKKYKLIKTSSVNNQTFIKTGGFLYSKNIQTKYAKQLWNLPQVTATKKEVLYNKNNHRYYTYYYVTYNFSYNGDTDSASGWTLASNLDYANPNSGLNKQAFALFDGAQTSTTYQLAVTHMANAFSAMGADAIDAYSYDDIIGNKNFKIYNFGLTVNPLPFGQLKNKPKVQAFINQFRAGKISFKNYLLTSLKNEGVTPSQFSGRTVGIYIYPKSSKLYGQGLIIVSNN